MKKWLILILLGASALTAQVPTTPAVVPHLTFVDNSGLACAACSLYTYAAGSTTPQATYTDSSGTSVNTNPIILGSDGGANIWLGTMSYKLVLIDTQGHTVFSVDNVNSSNIAACGAAGSIQVAAGGNGLTCDPTITINTVNHTLNIGTLPSAHVTIGAQGTPTSWNFDTTTPATALASLGGAAGNNPGTSNQLGYYAAAGSVLSGTSTIPAGITGTTQSPSDNSTNLATTAYVALPGAINPTTLQIGAGASMNASQGTGALLQHSTGSTTANNFVKFDATGNTVDSGVPASSATFTATQTDQTSSRALSGTYQNTNTFPIEVQGWITTTAGGADGQINCNNGPTSGLGNTPFSDNPTATDAGGHAEFHEIVPANWFYQCTASGTMNPTLGKWYEVALQ